METVGKKRVLVLVVTYHAEQFIEGVLRRIPARVLDNDAFACEILVIDDCSQDRTFHVAEEYSQRLEGHRLTVLYNPKNQGYGGNQKIGYYYAVQNGFDAVVLLHGDGQYPPEYIEEMVLPILGGEADAVFGSRMLRKMDALRGNMPFYKWVGNQVLTSLQNRILGVRLSEFHTGFRAYSVAALAAVPFNCNSNYFDFDTDIIIQLIDLNLRIKEIPIPTFYGEEVSRVNGLKYAYKILESSILSKIQKWGLFYHPRFDYSRQNSVYTAKFGFPSSHQFAYERVGEGSTVLDLGSGPGFMARELSKKAVRTISVDRCLQPETVEHSYQSVEADLDDSDFESMPGHVDTIFALDIIEHLKCPEEFLRKIRDRYSPYAPEVIITTANVGFVLVRCGLLVGQFNYGRKGILDLDHRRLFTFGSLRRTLAMAGYEIVEEEGIPAPFPTAFGLNLFSRFCLAVNRALMWISKGVFSYQIGVVARPLPTLRQLLSDAEEGQQRKLAERRMEG